MRGVRPFVKWRFGARAAAVLFGTGRSADLETEVGADDAVEPVSAARLAGPDAYELAGSDGYEEAADELSVILYSDLADVLRARRGEPVVDRATDRQAARPRQGGSGDERHADRSRGATSQGADRRPCGRS